MFLLITIYRLPRAIEVISAVPVNHFSGLGESSHAMSQKIKSLRKIFCN